MRTTLTSEPAAHRWRLPPTDGYGADVRRPAPATRTLVVRDGDPWPEAAVEVGQRVAGPDGGTVEVVALHGSLQADGTWVHNVVVTSGEPLEAEREQDVLPAQPASASATSTSPARRPGAGEPQ